MAQAPQQGPYQGSFTAAQIPFQEHHHAPLHQGRQGQSQGLGSRLIRQMQSRRRLVMIGRMHELDSTEKKPGITPEGPLGADNGTDWPATLGQWARELGFSALGIARPDLSRAEPQLRRWLELGRHGHMDYMAKHADLRLAPERLVPNTLSVISVLQSYLPPGADPAHILADGERAYVARYALGRDYHKLLRNRLQKLAERLQEAIGPFGFRCFADSAPVLEVELAGQAGLGWRGKHTLLLTRQGSWHFLGEIYTDLPLPAAQPQTNHCGQCQRCLDVCPTGAILAPYELDARRCISYLTIELHGPIPEPFRPLLGNRIYGCDDCQLVCPWNRFATPGDPQFSPREGLDAATLLQLFAWEATDFNDRLAGSPIRRIGHERWLRNIAVALGNSPGGPAVMQALRRRLDHPSPLVREHVAWALARLGEKNSG